MIIDRISRETGVSPDAIRAIASTASRRYMTYKIAKRTGGFREINHPTPVVKYLQRWIVRNFIAQIPVHSNVMSYKHGVGITKNAQLHVAQNYLLKLDFENFFPSIRDHDVRRLISDNINRPGFVDLNQDDIDFIVGITCRNGELTIGAPSSPAISNAILFDFDERMTKESTAHGVFYSRYADDISFSTNVPNVLFEIKLFVEKALEDQTSPRLRINEGKTIFTSKKRRRMVTGLVLTSEKRISIGRKKKREIRALCFQFKSGALNSERLSYLRGYLSFVSSVEPEFINSLWKKYGADTMQKIVGSPLVRRK